MMGEESSVLPQGSQTSEARVGSLSREELLRALGRSIDLLLEEAEEVRTFAEDLRSQLRCLSASDWA